MEHHIHIVDAVGFEDGHPAAPTLPTLSDNPLKVVDALIALLGMESLRAADESRDSAMERMLREAVAESDVERRGDA